MPERSASVNYTPYPTEQQSGNLGGGFNVKANPEDFGTQVSQAAVGAGNQVADLSQKFSGMINDTAAVNADADFATKVGQIKGDFLSKSGNDAFNSFPQYQADIRQAFQDSRANLPLAAQHSFDLTATRTMANHIADGSSFAASQLKEANRYAYSDNANVNIQAILDKNVATNQSRTDWHIDSAAYAAQAQVDHDHPGLKTDPQTGVVSWDESTSAGQQGKADLQRNIDAYRSQGYLNQYRTLSDIDPQSANDKYQQNKDSIPKGGQIAIEAMMAPKIFDQHKNTAVGNTMNDADQTHWQALTNPQSGNQPLSVRNNNPGNLRDPSTGQFRVFSTPEEGTQAMQADLTAKITGNSPAMEAKFGKNYSPTLSNLLNVYAPPQDNNNTAAYISTVSKETGIKPDQVLSTSDVAKLIPAMSKVEAGGSGGAIVAGPTEKAAYTTTQPSYGTNANGAPLSRADSYALNRANIYADGDAYAEKQMPGDLALRRAVRQTLENSINAAISNQHVQYTMDNRNVVRAINGELTNGKIPATEAELRQIPQLAPLLDKVAYQDPKFSETIPTLVAKAQKYNVDTNSPNGYSTVLRALEPNDPAEHPNRIESVDHLDKLLGRSDSTGINMKDYNDAKQVIEASQPWKDFLSKNMTEMSNANGNIDGKGQDRSLLWYNQAMQAKKANDAKGDKGVSEQELISQLDEGIHPTPPSRMQQIENWVKSKVSGNQSQIPTFSDPNDPAFAKLPSGSQFMVPGETIARTKK